MEFHIQIHLLLFFYKNMINFTMIYWVVPVSYTHLDVYKRQVLYSVMVQNWVLKIII